MFVSAARGVLGRIRQAFARLRGDRVATLGSREEVERELELTVLATYSPRKEW